MVRKCSLAANVRIVLKDNISYLHQMSLLCARIALHPRWLNVWEETKYSQLGDTGEHQHTVKTLLSAEMMLHALVETAQI